MKFFKLFRKNTALVYILAFLLLVLTSVCFKGAAGDTSKNAQSKKERQKFIKSLGIVTEGTETLKNITVPDNFGDVYGEYNKLQNKAGYDLSRYKGVNAVLYTYTVKGNAKARFSLNLIVYKGRVIGGDFCSAELDGKMVPLDKEEIKRCLK